MLSGSNGICAATTSPAADAPLPESAAEVASMPAEARMQVKVGTASLFAQPVSDAPAAVAIPQQSRAVVLKLVHGF